MNPNVKEFMSPKVTLDGELIQMESFEEYGKTYMHSGYELEANQETGQFLYEALKRFDFESVFFDLIHGDVLNACMLIVFE